jgi:hypothetical protein
VFANQRFTTTHTAPPSWEILGALIPSALLPLAPVLRHKDPTD